MPRPEQLVREVEEEAFLYGWPLERLYNDFWDRPRGLASVIEDTDEIISIDQTQAIIRGARGEIRRFLRIPVSQY